MDINTVIKLTSELIKIPTLSGQEQAGISFLLDSLSSFDWEMTELPVSSGRSNLLISAGAPKVLFTTHIDVVPGEFDLFNPRVVDGRLYGRGACDAKGILVCMLAAISRLRDMGYQDLGLLVVVGEEDDGIGARMAAKDLQGRGIRYLVNGEPTECAFAAAERGGLGFEIRVAGRAAHSGYPELGIDANRILLQVAQELLSESFGSDPTLGDATINIGKIVAGVGPSVVSPSASMSILLRTVSGHAPLRTQIEQIVAGRGTIVWTYDCPVVSMFIPDGEQSVVVKYCSDVPGFAALGAVPLMYGPGSIHQAHTHDEFIEIDELVKAIDGYVRLYKKLQR